METAIFIFFLLGVVMFALAFANVKMKDFVVFYGGVFFWSLALLLRMYHGFPPR